MPMKSPDDWDGMDDEAIRREGPGERFTGADTNPSAPDSKPAVKLLRESEWRKLLKPPHWLVENVIERGYLYSLTAKYGTGKTTVSLLLAYLMAAPNIFPRLFGSLEVERGAVAIFAGENPIDVIRKADGLRSHYKLGEEEADVFLVAGRFSIKDNAETLSAQVPKHKPLAMIIVDTAAAFFEGDDENGNTQMAEFARTLRKLTELPGNPAVLVLCHPAKNPGEDRDNMVPRGGSAFTGETDGNLILWKLEGDRLYEFGNFGKPLRNSNGFEPLRLELVSVPSIADTKGRPSSVGVAVVITEQEADARADLVVDNEKRVLDAIDFAPKQGLRHADLHAMLGLSKSTLTGILHRLHVDKKIDKSGSYFKPRTNKPNKQPSMKD